jgi:hypothetical protein
MAEFEKVKVTDATHKAFMNLDNRIQKYLKDLQARFTDPGSDADSSLNADADADADADANV